MARNDEIGIDHQRLIDGFGQQDSFAYYRPLDTYCGICDAPLTLLPRGQKYLLEVRRIPVKMLQRGAVYCVQCRRQRSRINWLKRGDRWRAEPRGAQELSRLLDEEGHLKARSQHRYEGAPWPYRTGLFEPIKNTFRPN